VKIKETVPGVADISYEFECDRFEISASGSLCIYECNTLFRAFNSDSWSTVKRVEDGEDGG
jgi:hypothetical protein